MVFIPHEYMRPGEGVGYGEMSTLEQHLTKAISRSGCTQPTTTWRETTGADTARPDIELLENPVCDRGRTRASGSMDPRLKEWVT